jgi:hypothetical protein
MRNRGQIEGGWLTHIRGSARRMPTGDEFGVITERWQKPKNVATLSKSPAAFNLITNKENEMIEKYKALEADLETERLRLAACGVAALGYFDGCKDEYRSASLEDTLRLYEINKELKAENEESKNALGDYFCSADDLAPAIRRLVSAYQERNQTAAKFMQELNETEEERDELKRQLAEYKADAANWRAHQKRKQEVIAAGMGRKILRDLETHDALPAFYKEMKKGTTE